MSVEITLTTTAGFRCRTESSLWWRWWRSSVEWSPCLRERVFFLTGRVRWSCARLDFSTNLLNDLPVSAVTPLGVRYGRETIPQSLQPCLRDLGWVTKDVATSLNRPRELVLTASDPGTSPKPILEVVVGLRKLDVILAVNTSRLLCGFFCMDTCVESGHAGGRQYSTSMHLLLHSDRGKTCGEGERDVPSR